MAKLTLKKAATDVTVYLFAQNSSVTTGAGLTGLTFETASLTAYYVRPLGSAAAITLATLAAVDSAHSDGGFKEVDATNMPGVYRLDLPDAVCATGVPSAVVMLKGAKNLAPVLLEIQLTDFDLNSTSNAVGAAASVTAGVTLADDAITASKFDESTAYPLKSADTGNTQVARVGADSDTLETLSDEIAAVKAETAAILVDTGTTLDGNITAILADTNEVQAELADGGRTDLLIDAIKAKTDNLPASPAPANEYDADFTQIVELLYSIMGGEAWTDETLVSIKALIDAIKTKTDSLTFTTPNKVDASATIDPTGLATSADLAVVDGNVDAIKEKTDQMVFTVANKIDASATVDPTGIATSEELEVIGEKVDGVLDKLNVSTVQFVTSVVGSTITILRGDTLTASLLNLGSLASYVSLDFTVKASTRQSDDDALIRVRKNASGLTDGLLRLNGAAHTTGTDGSITINDAPTGDITIMLKAGVTDDLVPGTYVYDIQLIEANEVSTLTTGTLIVSADVTRLVA